MDEGKDKDKEITAMSGIVAALEDLQTQERERVLRWACDRYGVELGVASGKSSGLATPAARGEALEFKEMATLYDAAQPKTNAEKALVAGYWHQQVLGQSDLDAQSLNTALKNLGHGIPNITWALTELQKEKPALVLQTHKGGKSKQARKKYKLTAAGIKAVQSMVVGEHAEEG